MVLCFALIYFYCAYVDVFHQIKKPSFHYTRGITPKRVTSGGIHLRGWATQLRRNVATVASRWRHRVDLSDQGFEPQTSRTDSECAKQLGFLAFQWKVVCLWQLNHFVLIAKRN